MADPEHAGVTWRAPRRDEIDALFDLHAAFEEASSQPWRTSRDEIDHEMASPATSLADDVRVAVDPQGRFLASAWARFTSMPGFKHRVYLMTTARPGHEALEDRAIEWGLIRSRTLMASTMDGMERVVRTFAEADDHRRITRYESAGFTVVRYFVDMARSLQDPVAPAALPDGVTIEPWADHWVVPSWEAHREAFADHWGSVPPPLQEWRHWVTAPTFRPDLSLVATADGTVVSYALNGVYRHDWELRGRREGWVDALGTRRRWRRRGLATALISESIRRFAATPELDHAAIGVDAENPTGAFALYERLGFRETGRSVSLLLDLASG